jgi:chemotaxis protein methyltransferase CheR
MNRQQSGPNTLTSHDLKNSEFEKVRNLLFDYCGISLHEGKRALVRARLMKRIRKLKLSGFDEYLNYVETDNSGAEFLSLVDVLTTNKTSFFRESQHFDFIRDNVIPSIRGRSVKWWSAGCSTGEEPISWAITLLEENSEVTRNDVKILATDLSRDVLQVAKQGIYRPEKLAGVPNFVLKRYFSQAEDGDYIVSDRIRRMITYGRLNLTEPWPMKGPFNIIMCRNVMIYFNRKTQQELISRFYDLLEPGGYLFLGHSESVSGSNHGFVNVEPAAYQKKK